MANMLFIKILQYHVYIQNKFCKMKISSQNMSYEDSNLCIITPIPKYFMVCIKIVINPIKILKNLRYTIKT